MFLFVCFFKIRRPTNTTLFPYTTLFRSSMGHARALLAVDSAEHQISIAHQIVTKSLSVRDAEQMVKRAHARTPANAQKSHGVSNNTEAPNIAAAETKLSKRLEAPVKIRLGRAGGVVEIRFSSGDDLARLFDTLMQSQAR